MGKPYHAHAGSVVWTQSNADELYRSDSDIYTRPSFVGRMSIAANRIIYTRAYIWLYLCMAALNLFLLVWGIAAHEFLNSLEGEDAWYIVLDMFASSVLAVEVFMRICATYKTFFSYWLNVVDFVVMLMCIASLALYMLDPETAIIGTTVILIRYVAQLIRLFLAFRAIRRQRAIQQGMDQDICFNKFENPKFDYVPTGVKDIDGHVVLQNPLDGIHLDRALSQPDADVGAQGEGHRNAGSALPGATYDAHRFASSHHGAQHGHSRGQVQHLRSAATDAYAISHVESSALPASSAVHTAETAEEADANGYDAHVVHTTAHADFDIESRIRSNTSGPRDVRQAQASHLSSPLGRAVSASVPRRQRSVLEFESGTSVESSASYVD